MKWTCIKRRGIGHLASFVLEDLDYGLYDKAHPMYRRLDSKERRELRELWEWLAVEFNREQEKPAQGEPPSLEAIASAPGTPPLLTCPLFDESTTTAIEEPAHVAP